MDTAERLVKFLQNPSEILAGITNAIISKTVEEIQQWDASRIGQTIVEDLLVAVQDVAKTDNGPDAIQGLFDHGFIHIFSAIFQKISDVETDDVCSQTLLELLIHVLADLGAPVKSEITEKLVRHFMDALENPKLSFQTRMEALKSTNILLEQCPTNLKESLLNRNDFFDTMVKLKDLLFFIGDYEFQVGVVECLFRIFPKKLRKRYATLLINNSNVVQQLLEIRDADFEMDCRNFLNELNSNCTRNRRVYSIPCISAHLGQKQLRKPSDSGYDRFWVDFNVGSERISMFCEQDKSDCQESQGDDLWETIAISKPDMRRCFSYEIPGKFVINFEFKAPVCEIYPSQQSIHESTMKIEFPVEFTSIVEEAMKHTFRLGDESSAKQRKVSVVSEPVKISRIEESAIQQAEEFSPADICPPSQVSASSQVSATTKRKVSVPYTPMRAPIHISAPVDIDRSSSLASIKTRPDTRTSEPIQDAHIMLKKKMESQQRKSSGKVSSLPSKHEDKTPLAENEHADIGKMPSKRNVSRAKVKTPVVVIHPTTDQKISKKKKGGSKTNKNQLDNEIRHPEGSELNHQTICCDDKFAETIPDSLQVPKPQDDTLCEKPIDTRLNLHDSGIDLNETASLLDVSKPKESLENTTITSEKGQIVQNDNEYARSSTNGKKRQLHEQIANLSKNNNRVSGKDEVSKKHAQNWAESESNLGTSANEEKDEIKDKVGRRAGKMNRTTKQDQVGAENVDDFARNQTEKTRNRTRKNMENLDYDKTDEDISGPKSSVMNAFVPLPVNLDEPCILRVNIHEEKGINLENNQQISEVKQNEYQDGRRNKEKRKKRKEKNAIKADSVSEEIVFDDNLYGKEEHISELNVNEDQRIKKNKETKKKGKDTFSEEVVLDDNNEPQNPVERFEYDRRKNVGSRYMNNRGMEKGDQDGKDYSSVPVGMIKDASGKKIKTDVKVRKVKRKKKSSEPEPEESDHLEEKLAPKEVENATKAEETESSMEGKVSKDEKIKVVKETTSPKQYQATNIKKDKHFQKLLEDELQDSSYVFNKRSRKDSKKNDKNKSKESNNEKYHCEPERSNIDKERKTSDKCTIDWAKKKRSLYSDGKDYLQIGKLSDDLEIPAFDQVFGNKDIVSKDNVKDTNISSNSKTDKSCISSKKNSRKDDGITKKSANLAHDEHDDDTKHHESEKFNNKLAITDSSSSKNRIGVESENTTCDNINNSCNESSCADSFSMTTMTKTAVQKIDESRMAIFMSYSAQKTYSHRNRASNRTRPSANSDTVNEKHISPDKSRILSNKMKTSRIYESKNSNGIGFRHQEENEHQNQKEECKENSVAEYDPYDFELECERLSKRSERLTIGEKAHAVFKKDETSKNHKSEKPTKAQKPKGFLQHDMKTNIWKRKSLEKIEELRNGANMWSQHFTDDDNDKGPSSNKEQIKSSSLKVKPLSECHDKFEWEASFEDLDIDNSKQHVKKNNRTNKNGQNERHNDEMNRKSLASKTNKSKVGKLTDDEDEIQKDFEKKNFAMKGRNKQDRFDDEFKALDVEHEELDISMDDEIENRKKMEYDKKKEREPPGRKNTEEIDSLDIGGQQPSTCSIVDNFSKIFQTIVSAGESGDLENNNNSGKDKSRRKNYKNEIEEQESCSDDQGQNIDKIKQRCRRQRNPIVYKDLSDSEIDREDRESDNVKESDDQPEQAYGAGISDLDSFYTCDSIEKSWIKAYKDPEKEWRTKKTYTKGYIKGGHSEELEKSHVSEKLMDNLSTQLTPQVASTGTPLITPSIKMLSACTPGLKSWTITSHDKNGTEDIEMVPSQLAMDETSTIDTPYLKKLFGISENEEDEESSNEVEPEGNLVSFNKTVQTHHKGSELKSENIEMVPSELAMDDVSTVDTPYLKKLFCISENKEDEESNNEAEPVGNLVSFNKTVKTHHRGSELKSGPSSHARLPRSLLKRKYPGIEDDSAPSASSQESCNSKTEGETSHLVPRKLFKNSLPDADKNMQVVLQSQKDSEERLTCTTEEEQIQLEVMCEAEVTGSSKLMQAFGIDFQKHLTFKHQKLEMLGKEALGSIQNQLCQSWKGQRQNRNHFHHLFKERMAKELGLLEQDINEIQEEESKTNEFFKQQAVMLRRNHQSQRQRLDNMKDLQSTLNDWLQRAEKECVIRKGNDIEFLRNEMKNLQKKILLESQKEELLNVRRCLQSMF